MHTHGAFDTQLTCVNQTFGKSQSKVTRSG